jgi:hypothetical protein
MICGRKSPSDGRKGPSAVYVTVHSRKLLRRPFCLELLGSAVFISWVTIWLLGWPSSNPTASARLAAGKVCGKRRL